MTRFFEGLVAMVFGAIFMIFMFMLLITPEKDKNGNYTEFVKYWTSNEYLCSNFVIKGNYCKRG